MAFGNIGMVLILSIGLLFALAVSLAEPEPQKIGVPEGYLIVEPKAENIQAYDIWVVIDG